MLLDTKLMKPHLPDHLIEREALLQAMDTALHRPLTLISAPPGYGKTTLVGQWLERRQIAHAWLSLDIHDNHPAGFWRAICSALGKHEARLFERTWPGFNPLEATPGSIDIHEALQALVRALLDYSRTWKAPRCLMLVLDDFHVIEDADLLRQFSYFLDYCPDFLRCLIITRHDPALDLPRRRVRHQLQEIRTADLRFDLASADLFLTQRIGLLLPKQDLRLLLDKTEGWVAALQLAGASIAVQTRPDQPITPAASALISKTLAALSAFGGKNQLLSDYLFTEVFDRQTAETQSFLLDVAHFSRFTADLCNFARKADDSAALIRLVRQRNLLIQPLDDQGRWFRLHDLFRDWLLGQQPESEQQTALRHRAASWFTSQSLWQEALDTWLASGEWEKAAAVVAQALEDWLRHGIVMSAAHWLQRFPVAWRSSNPWLAFLSAIMHFNQGNYDEANRFLRQAMAATSPEKADTANLIPLITLLRSHLALYSGNLLEASALAKDVAASPQQIPALQSWILQGIGTDHLFHGNIQQATEFLLSAMQAAIAQQDHFCQMTNLAWLAPALLRQGEMDLAWHWIDRIESELGTGWRSHPLAYALPFLRAPILQERNRLDAAWQSLEEAFALGGEQITAINRIYMLFLRWRLCLQRDQPDLADGTLEQITLAHSMGYNASKSTTGSNWPYVIPGIDCMKAITQIARGDPSTLIRWSLSVKLEAFPVTPDEVLAGHYDGPPLRYLIEQLLWIRAQLLMRQDVFAHLYAARRFAEATGDKLHLLQSWLIEAAAKSAMDEPKEATAAMIQALTLSAATGLTRVFADEGPMIPALLQQCLTLPLVATEAKRLVEALEWMPSGDKRPPATPPAMEPLAEPLSERELEVLQRLHSGQTNKQLADTLGIAPSTVKAHLHNIYGKLGAANRTQALAQARRLGLLN